MPSRLLLPDTAFFVRFRRNQRRGGNKRRKKPSGRRVRIVSSKRSVKSKPPRQSPACGPNESSMREHEESDGRDIAVGFAGCRFADYGFAVVDSRVMDLCKELSYRRLKRREKDGNKVKLGL
jgi:hypothetical protein